MAREAKATWFMHLISVGKYVRFEVFTAESMKTAIFWVVEPCSLVEVYRRYRGVCCLHQGDRHLHGEVC
jgi:hypothetical protein